MPQGYINEEKSTLIWLSQGIKTEVSTESQNNLNKILEVAIDSVNDVHWFFQFLEKNLNKFSLFLFICRDVFDFIAHHLSTSASVDLKYVCSKVPRSQYFIKELTWDYKITIQKDPCVYLI